MPVDRLVSTLLFAVLLAATAASAAAAEGSAILAIEPVTLPSWEEYRGIERYASDREEYARVAADRRYVLERITYRSGELAVYAYLYRPASPPPASGLPVVVFNRGSYVRDGFAPEVLMPGHRLAQEGFLVVAPMLRGSGGAEGKDEMGGAEVADLHAIVAVLRELPAADVDRIFLYGESRGGLMSLLAAKQGFPARAMAVYGTIADFGAYLAEGQPARSFAPRIWPGFPEHEAEIADSRSAVRWAEKIDVPVLILHGGDDGDVSPLQALALATALERTGKAFELSIYHGSGHVLSNRAAERDAAAMRWFRRFDRGPVSP